MEKTVRIYRRPKNAMQSGRAQTAEFSLEFDPESPPSTDPVMGWHSSADTRAQLHLKFKTLPEALNYAKNNGLKALVVDNPSQSLKIQSYADNFKSDRVKY